MVFARMIDAQSFWGAHAPRVQRLTPRQPQPGAPPRSKAPPSLPLPGASVPKLKSQRLIPIQNAESDLCQNGVTAFGRKPHSFISPLRPKNEPRSPILGATRTTPYPSHQPCFPTDSVLPRVTKRYQAYQGRKYFMSEAAKNLQIIGQIQQKWLSKQPKNTFNFCAKSSQLPCPINPQPSPNYRLP